MKSFFTFHVEAFYWCGHALKQVQAERHVALERVLQYGEIAAVAQTAIQKVRWPPRQEAKFSDWQRRLSLLNLADWAVTLAEGAVMLL